MSVAPCGSMPNSRLDRIGVVGALVFIHHSIILAVGAIRQPIHLLLGTIRLLTVVATIIIFIRALLCQRLPLSRSSLLSLVFAVLLLFVIRVILV